jgi:hypothetical protein
VLKGTRPAVVQRIQRISIHVFWFDPDDPEQELRHARVGAESAPRNLEVGDKVTMHFVMGMVSEITKGEKEA